MARIHARVKGKSSSKRPVNADLSFVNLKKKEVIDLIIKLKQEGKSLSLIGMILRDSHGLGSVKKFIGKSISDILSENKMGLEIPEDLTFMIEKFKLLKKHLENNSRDIHNRRAMILLESKIRRLSKYYKRVNKIPLGWSYN